MATINPRTTMTTMTEGIPLTGTGTAHGLLTTTRMRTAADPTMANHLRMGVDLIMMEARLLIPT